MRVALFRFALVMGMLALAPAIQAKSYVVLLKSPMDADHHVHIVNNKGTFGINNPGYGAAIDQYIRTVRRYEPEQINADFSDALESMSSILAAGLPPLSHSYAALLELLPKPLGKVVIDSERGNVILDKRGLGVLIDGYSDEPFEVDMKQVRNDFGPALASLDEIIQDGFRPTTYLVLLESPDGSVGKVSIQDARGRTLVEEPGQAVDMGAFLTDERVFKLEDKAIRKDFGNAIEYQPQLPAKYVLLFRIGSTKLAAESEQEVGKLLDDVRTRPAPDVTIYGHADTVGRDALNDKLSQRRAEFVAELIQTLGATPQALEIEHYGKRKPLVKTPDNTPELRNRRVEVTVR